ncbi:hypothetical protein [Vibrio sp. 03_296]|uniref:hypothetical protein n=1 Tax=Vibrio sp. 03_296 TaxID=2024409 RepID=UPI0034E897FF
MAEKGSRSHLNTLWVNKVLKPYERSIKGRYPFEPRAKTEVTLKDFSRFFGYGGTLDAFFVEYLEPFVDTSRSAWRFERKSVLVKKHSPYSNEQIASDSHFLNSTIH